MSLVVQMCSLPFAGLHCHVGLSLGTVDSGGATKMGLT